jgi:hypothetical protein
MSFAAWDMIWIVIGGLYGIMAVAWGIIVWRGRPWSLDLLLAPTGPGEAKTSRVRFPN